MIKFKTTHNKIVIGLGLEDIKKIKKGEALVIEKEDLKIKDDILIASEKTLDEINKNLNPNLIN